MVTPESRPYPARLEIDYAERLDRVTSFFRLLWVIPIAIVLGLLTGGGTTTYTTVTTTDATVEKVTQSSGGIVTGLFLGAAATWVLVAPFAEPQRPQSEMGWRPS